MSRKRKIEDGYQVTPLGCWEWTGYVDRNGYGRAYDETAPRRRRVDWAHRVYYRRHVGEIPERSQLDHLCENTKCVNPQHLEPVSVAEHAFRTVARAGGYILPRQAAALRRTGMTYADIAEVLGLLGKESAFSAVQTAIKAGYVARDDVPHQRHLTDQERADILDLYQLGVPQTELGLWYNTDSSQISRICNGKRSGHDKASIR